VDVHGRNDRFFPLIVLASLWWAISGGPGSGVSLEWSLRHGAVTKSAENRNFPVQSDQFATVEVVVGFACAPRQCDGKPADWLN
jgi:hypothetical protein